MVEWQHHSLAELIENLDAKRVPVKESDRRPGPYPYYGASGVVDHIDDFLFEGLHLLIAEDGENLRSRKLPIAFLANDRFWVNNHAHIVRGNDKADTRFLLYAILMADVTSYLSGSTMPKLTQGNLNRIPIFAPCKTEQETIASVLGAFDDKIALNNRMNETLEAMVRAVFKDWFIDFGPTRAKMKGRPPYLAPDIWSLFPDRLDSDNQPKGWEIFLLAELAVHHTRVLTPMATPDTEFEHFSLPAYDSGKSPAIDRGETIKSNKTLMPPDAVLLSKLNPEIERVWIPEVKSGRPQICSTEFLVFSPTALSNHALLFGLFTESTFRGRLRSMVTGTSKSHQRASPHSLLQNEALVGNKKAFAQYAEIVNTSLQRVLTNRAETRTLAATRDLLLPKLMLGDIRLKDAAKTVGAAG